MKTQSTALITGASSSIGAIYADRLARRGYDLVLVARDEHRLKTLATRISEDTNRSVKVVAADLTNDADLVLVEQVLRIDASIEVLVNNAGIVLSGEVATADPARLESMIRLNVLAPTRLAAAVIPGFVARGHGTLINIGSAVALAPVWFNGAYSGTKAYVLNLSEKLQQELAGTGAFECRLCCLVRSEQRCGRRAASTSSEAQSRGGFRMSRLALPLSRLAGAVEAHSS